MKTIRTVGTVLMAAVLSRAQTSAGAAVLPRGVRAFRDVAYVENGHVRQKLDLYLPEKSDAPVPLLIWIHGGGWRAGSKEGCPPLRQGFVQRGYAVASLDYRLSGDAVFPAQIEDCKAAVRWLRANAGTYGIAPDRFGVWGSSAGGHLVALLGTSGDEKIFDAGARSDVSSRVQAVCDYYGPTDLTRMDAQAVPGARLKHDDDQSPEACLIGGAVQANKDKAARASPVTYISTNALPPFLIVHGDADPVVPFQQSKLLFDALKKAGGNVHLHCVKGAEHGKGFGGRDVTDGVAAFFDRWLKAVGNPAVIAEAVETESAAVPETPRGEASARGPQAGVRVPDGRRITFEQIRASDDADGDGRVTRDEFKGPLRLFDRLDRNGDRALTREDFQGGQSDK